ncbi:Ribosome biogenesis protein Kri1 [Aspergillus sclerotialis]|uniref:Ribosome biogenesis protein Kri1 n=1 Tax=Aspergillus sclerotialis TaxID=2070753 RepID=A0A3A2Z8Y3_9EURO|nr:Ribosome biogenesis protein Kri1 [Aspergillus sclerotialis]
MEPPSKKPRKLLDEDSSSDSGNESGGVPIGEGTDYNFKINEEYARRFEHNKKREEKQQLEAKLGKTSSLGKRRNRDEDEESDDSDSSSDDEDEDEDGELATEALDSEIMATLNAIRSKDPRVYDKNATFYSAETETLPTGGEKKEKPMFLRDYHRENLLSGANLAEDDSAKPPKTYAQEQEDLKNAIVKEMHGKVDDEGDDKEADEDGGFLIPKSAPVTAPAPKREPKLDIENADKDPENFLSNFMSSRAWIPTDRTDFQPFESDDDEEDARADALEEAYNFRFEDPNKVNEKLITHARDSTNKYSVRREEKSSRKKHREAERMAKEQEKKQREAEKNRLRKLKADELHEKVKQIKEVAGIRASKFTDEDWAQFLDGAWNDKDWEEEMQKRFGEDYYAEEDERGGEDGKGKKKHPKKPTWDDDIDITDIVPDFDEEKPTVEQSDVEMEDENDSGEGSSANKKSKAQEKREKRRDARKERLRIEEAIDRNLDLDITLLPGATKKNASRFRYRETSPQSFGLTARDILMADDARLNEFAGLKKLASFRDAEKKRRDQKKLGKKARLRQWRKDTFGNEEGPEFVFGGEKAQKEEDATGESKVDIREGEPRKKRRKRSKKN